MRWSTTHRKTPAACHRSWCPDLRSRPAAPAPLQMDPRQWVACLLTSGSTGAPQPQRKRWDALQLSIDAEARSLCALLDWPSIVGLNIVATVPPQHSYGFESSVLLALLGGAAFDAGRPFYPADIAEALARLPRPRALVTTPVHLKALLLSGASLPPVDLVLSATAPLSPQLAQQAESRLACRLIEIYGCTEAGQVAARRTTATEVWTTLAGLSVESQPSDDGERFVGQRRPRARTDAAGRPARADRCAALSPARARQRSDPRGGQAQFAGAPELSPEPHRRRRRRRVLAARRRGRWRGAAGGVRGGTRP